VKTAVGEIINENSILADPWIMVLCNMSRVETLVPDILRQIDVDNGKTLLELAKAFAKVDYNKKGQTLNYLGNHIIFVNLKTY